MKTGTRLSTTNGSSLPLVQAEGRLRRSTWPAVEFEDVTVLLITDNAGHVLPNIEADRETRFRRS